jgi:hypothetical protein
MLADTKTNSQTVQRAFLFVHFGFIAPKTFNYLAFQSSDFERTWWSLYQKSVVRTKLYIYHFITSEIIWLLVSCLGPLDCLAICFGVCKHFSFTNDNSLQTVAYYELRQIVLRPLYSLVNTNILFIFNITANRKDGLHFCTAGYNTSKRSSASCVCRITYRYTTVPDDRK